MATIKKIFYLFAGIFLCLLSLAAVVVFFPVILFLLFRVAQNSGSAGLEQQYGAIFLGADLPRNIMDKMLSVIRYLLNKTSDAFHEVTAKPKQPSSNV